MEAKAKAEAEAEAEAKAVVVMLAALPSARVYLLSQGQRSRQ